MGGCLIIGDSIAVGIGQQLTQCQTLATTGVSSAAWLLQHGPLLGGAPQGTVIVSLGANDGANFDKFMLEALRVRIGAKRVIWIAPSNNLQAVAVVVAIAKHYGDQVVGFQPGRDGVHPESYRSLAQSVCCRR
jgi:hypothetical protein